VQGERDVRNLRPLRPVERRPGAGEGVRVPNMRRPNDMDRDVNGARNNMLAPATALLGYGPDYRAHA
jgi:hypothetical protein